MMNELNLYPRLAMPPLATEQKPSACGGTLFARSEPTAVMMSCIVRMFAPVTSADFAALKINPRLWIDRGWIVPIGKDGRRTLYAAGDPLPADFPARGWGRELAAMRRAARSSLA